jgi:hypothetical protein
MPASIPIQSIKFISTLNDTSTYPSQLELSVFDPGSCSMSQVYGAAVVTDNPSYVQRLMSLFKLSLIPENFPKIPEQAIIVIQLPSMSCARYPHFGQTLIETTIRNFGAPWDKLKIIFIDAVDALHYAQQFFIHQPELTTIIIGAIDSVFDQDAIRELDQQNELWTTSNSDGIALGEATAWLLLTRDAPKAPLLMKHYANADDKYSLVSAVEQLQLQQRIDLVIKLFSNSTHNINQLHEISLRFLDEQVQVVDLAAQCGYLGCAGSTVALAYLANNAELNKTPWNTALILHKDLDTHSAHSYLITQGNIHEHHTNQNPHT